MMIPLLGDGKWRFSIVIVNRRIGSGPQQESHTFRLILNHTTTNKNEMHKSFVKLQNSVFYGLTNNVKVCFLHVFVYPAKWNFAR